MTIKIKQDGFTIYRPYGMVSKDDRERADRLDEVLDAKIPEIAKETLARPESKNVLAKWYFLGTEISKILDDPNLVLRSDIASGDIWWAIWQKLPEDFDMKYAGKERDSKSAQNGNRDTLARAYVLARFSWDDIGWLQRWTDWTDLYSRDIFWKDERILKALKDTITKLKPYPKRDQYRDILKAVRKELPSSRDTTALDEAKIKRIVENAVLESKKP